MRAFFLLALSLQAQRFPENPLITTSPSLGDNVNGPSVIRVPHWIKHPLGRYYMYFAHHKGDHIRLAYSNDLHGPWKIYEPGVLHVKDSIFYRPQPDPPEPSSNFYTHVASPEIEIDDAHHQLTLYFHGMYTEGQRWPDNLKSATEWTRSHGYAQFTQAATSTDGIHFKPIPSITAKTSYLRTFRWHNTNYGMARLGVLLNSNHEIGPNPFADTPYANRVRHVGLLVRGDTLYVFFSAIGDAPERILLSTIALTADWTQWLASPPREILSPEKPYECPQLPVIASKIGESEGPEHALRDPAVFEERGKIFLFYSVCGEQGIGAAEVTSAIH
jgi:hypothetical protein